MTTYLEGGWYKTGAKGLRPEVVDGAMDAAGLLHRARVNPNGVTALALKIRSFMTLLDRDLSRGPTLSTEDLERVRERVQTYAQEVPELSAFVSDCLDHVATRNDLMAVYLHLIHVTRMMQLLEMTRAVLPGLSASKPAKAPAPVKKKKKVLPSKKVAKKPAKKKKPVKKAKAASKSKRGKR